jgi:cell fate (sporulation/competence/biofilm development) regulator YlbF (YheA/YmcA/DUF963 family)
MNYDKAHELQKAMRESEEFKALMEAQAAVVMLLLKDW